MINKSAYRRRIVIRGLLVMALLFLVINERSLSSQNKPPTASVQVLPLLSISAPYAASTEINRKSSTTTTSISTSTSAYLKNAQPERSPQPQSQPAKAAAALPVAAAAAKASKTVYLTFDDGPSPITAKVLGILQQEKVKATFFVLGEQAETHPELINAIWEQGHTIGNHTYNHNYQELYSGFPAFWSQIKQTEEIIRSITGIRPQLIRAPGGTFGHFDHTYFNLLEQAGYRVMDWTADSGDSKRRGVPAADIVRESTADLQASKVVLLLHDGDGHEASAEALPRIIAKYKAAGYVFGQLNDHVEPVQFRVSSKSVPKRTKPSASWIAAHVTPNAGLFAAGKPLVLEVGMLETSLQTGEYSIRDGQYRVPLRAVIERLGGEVSWDPLSRSGKVKWNGNAVTVDVGKQKLILNLKSGLQAEHPARVELIGGSIWIPLRDLLETAGHPPLKVSVTDGERRVKAL
ncbi:polysaccharide deacetylase [Paenibacillus albidus]|uniref:polysaccharide deacetylase n=1 Tax=Paenibacillus albidus TaxID=2041023 RepID=UPI001BE81C27|nr:polysaccharide deacetylase [Paenibacillus albidus]MBT2293414.1 polysaccharide deacetylase [Paenibacillus albidus]